MYFQSNNNFQSCNEFEPLLFSRRAAFMPTCCLLTFWDTTLREVTTYDASFFWPGVGFDLATMTTPWAGTTSLSALLLLSLHISGVMSMSTSTTVNFTGKP